MTATCTGTTALDQLLDEVVGLGIKFTGTATASGQTVTTNSPIINRGGANKPPTDLQGRYLWIPSETGDDRVHSITTVSVAASTGVTTITTLDTYDSTTTAGTMYVLAIHPDILINLLNDGLEVEYTDITLPLSADITDGDMQTSGVTNWSDTNATSSKVTTAANVLYGVRGLRVLNSGANGYTATAAASRIARGKTFRVWAIVRADVGTAVLTVVDTSGNSLASVEYSEENWGLVWVDMSPGSTIEEVKFRLGGSGASDDTYWAAVGYYRPDEMNLDLPSWADAKHKVKALSVAEFRGTTDSTAYQARSRSLRRLDEGVDWRYVNEGASLHPDYIELLRRDLLSDMPLYLTGTRPRSDFGTLTSGGDMSDTVYIELQVWKERAKQLLGERYPAAFPGMAEIAAGKLAQRETLRATEPPVEQVKVRRMFR